MSEDVSEEGKASRAKTFLAEMKKSLSQVNFDRIVQALQTYKKTDNLDVLLTETAVLTEDTNTHSLLRGKSCAVMTSKASYESHTFTLRFISTSFNRRNCNTLNPLTFNLTPSSGQNVNFVQYFDQIPAKLVTFPLASALFSVKCCF